MTAPRLFLFMTEGMSLTRWRELGMLDRELALYRRLSPQLAAIVIVSYGGRADTRIVADEAGIEVICNRWGLPQGLYRRLLPHLLGGARRGPAIFKSNQLRGADLALRLARRCGAAFIARCGYLLSDFEAQAHGRASAEHGAAQQLEAHVFGGADHCVVTTEAMRVRLREYGLPDERLSVIPNYVDTGVFSPSTAPAVSGRRVIFVGRLDEQKNPITLVQALAGLDVTLDLVGEGRLRSSVEAEARRRGVDVRFHGNLPHLALPAIIRAGDLFVLPSHYEGHPKTLLEAMACGIAVVGSNVPGIRDVIRHRRTGWLCEPSVEGIRQAVTTLLEDPVLRVSLGRKARDFIVAEYDLGLVVEREMAVYRRVMERGAVVV